MPDQNPDEELHRAFTIAMRKGQERYVFVFDEASFGETSKTFARFANDPNLSFSWHDATVLGEHLQKIRAKLLNNQDNDE